MKPRTARTSIDDSRGTDASSAAAQVSVVLPATRGALRVGDMVPGKPYLVPAHEAIRLVTGKGFNYASPADAELAEGFTASNAAAPADAEDAATAAGVGGGDSSTTTSE